MIISPTEKYLVDRIISDCLQLSMVASADAKQYLMQRLQEALTEEQANG